MSDESTTENENVAENATENSSENQVESEIATVSIPATENVIETSGNGSTDDVDKETESVDKQTDIPTENDEATDLFDSLKTNDEVDGATNSEEQPIAVEEPMEVDEVSNGSEDKVDAEEEEEAEKDRTETDAQEQADSPQIQNEDSGNDEVATSASEAIQMEVDCETPQGEDVPDLANCETTQDEDVTDLADHEAHQGEDVADLADSEAPQGEDVADLADCETTQGEDMADTTDTADTTNDPVMEHNVEQLNCSNLSDETQKEQTISDDPFDSLLRNDDVSSNNLDAGPRSNTDELDEQNEIGEAADSDHDDDDNDDRGDNDDRADNDDHGDNDDHDDHDDHDDQDTSSHHDGSTNEAVDDIEEGKGADEELCLLPDEEREISDADKERAMQNQQQADENENENEDQENEAGEGNLEAIEENGEKDGAEVQESEDQESETVPDNEVGEQTQIDTSTAPFEPNVDEIKEIEADAIQENLCTECGQTIKCKFAMLKEIAPAEDDIDAAVASEVQYLCDTACVTKFNNANTQYKVVVKKVPIFYCMDTEQTCKSCKQTKSSKYRFKEATDADTFSYICEEECLNNFTSAHPEKFVTAKKRFIIEENSDDVESEKKCMQCSDETNCKYTFKEDLESFYLCNDPCLNLLMAEQPDRFRFKRQSIRVKDLSRKPINATVLAPRESKRTTSTTEKSKKMVARTEDQQRIATLDREASFSRRCGQCYSDIMLLESNLQWETMDFCNESCLGQYQQAVGAACQTCQNAVSIASMGKYCVRFGFELRQFCRSACLDTFKKGLKVCSYCQLDIAKNDEFLAPINGQFKDFCSKKCMRFYEHIFNNKKQTKICAVCNNQKIVRVEIIVDSNVHYFCSNPCFSAFSFVNNVSPDSCSMCRKYFERKSSNAHTIYQGNDSKMFCSKICMNIYIIAKREIAPCQWCKVRKYNFDMIQKVSSSHGLMMLCSINCLSMCEVSMNAIAMKQQKCDQCNSMTTPQYHLTMSDASMRNFCTYQCVMSFQSQFSRTPLTLENELADQRSQPVPTGLPKRIKAQQLKQQQAQVQAQAKGKTGPATRLTKANNFQASKQPNASNNLIISSVTSLATATRSTRRSNQAQNNSISVELNRLQPVVELEPLPDSIIEKTTRPVGRPRNTPIEPTAPAAPQVRIEKQTQIVTIPPLPKKITNAATMCAPSTHNKEVQARPMQFTVGCQTESFLERKMVIPIPVPIYLPTPTPMYAQPFPVPVPIPLPIPVPVFIPTTRNSANGIMKEIKKIQDKMPADPFEAELLMMAEMVAGDKKKEEETDSSEEETDYHNEEISGNNFGEDIMQMALKMATEYDPAAVDLEASMQTNTITPHSHPGMAGHDVMHNHQMMMMDEPRTTRKRGPPPRAQRQPAKRTRRGAIQEQPPPEPQREPIEKADANMCLKFTFGVNAWKQWVMTKNSELEKSSMRRKLFKTELLQLTADELNYSLCLFVKEVRKPNGSEYAPDTIYYLVLGIQEYLYENGRIDNIFTDPYYERFTDCLDEVAKKFSVLYNDSQYIVTRVEEEHLWECKQLGAHSPHVLLSTLMFFNTKHFNLTTVEEHMQLSFSHIMKHWKRNPNQGSGKMAGSRNVLLRFYPPQSAHIDNSRKKKVYEQQENEENPLRCPVKLYEFYLSKCPESVKTRNDVFYLLPERSCVPDSPVWYSTQALGKEALSKMLHRVKMVKEINIALLTS